MPRSPARVTQADIARVLRAVAQSGMKMRVQILPGGQIILEPAEVAASQQAEQYNGEIKLW